MVNFKIKINTIFKDDKRNITIIDRENRIDKKGHNWRYYKYRCNKCGYEGWNEESHLLTRNQGCGACCPTPRVVVLGINTIWDTDKWLIPIINDDEFCKTHTHSCGDSIYPVCPDCGRVKSKKMRINSIYCSRSIGCSCSDGMKLPNKFMHNLLEQLQVKFESEIVFDWCKYKFKGKEKQGRYDFLLNLDNQKYIIEMDGGFHTRDNNMNGQTSKESKYIDDEKDRLANEHNIEVIRIDCCYKNNNRFEYVKKNILTNNTLNKLFDLRNIDWVKCYEFTLSNLTKIACEYKKNNPNLTTTEIGKLMNLEKSTIIKYLKQGNELNWCEYDANKEMIKRNGENGKLSGKAIKMFKNNIFVNKFESARDLERQSEKLFGIKLDYRGISAVCNGKRKQYNGFTFEFN